MESYQCLVIGISRYQFLKPLSHGEEDAKAIYQFFIKEAKIRAQQVLLVSDTSPAIKGLSTYPNQDNLLNCIRLINQEISSTQTQMSPLWIFFNGYGLNYQGEDYLMSIDGNPQDIPNTGVSVRSILNLIQKPTTRPILLILNLYDLGLGKKVGQQLISMAKQKGIALIFSLRPPDKTNRGHSIFTTALLEALQYYRHEITLAQFAQYLGDRLPSFNFQGRGVVSSPIVISPSLAFSSQPLFPPETESLKPPIFITSSAPNTVSHLPLLSSASVATAVSPSREEQKIPPPPREVHPSPRQSSIINLIQEWKWLVLGGLCGFFGLIFLVFWLRWMLLNPASDSSKISLTSSEVESQRELLNRAKNYLKENQASSFSRAINEVRSIPLSSPVYPEVEKKISHWSQVILDIAQGRAKQGNFKDAIAAARLVPSDHEQVYTTALKAIKRWQEQDQQQQVNTTLIQGAKALIKPFSASSYNQGITILRQISPLEPGYPQAQQLIHQWSEKIYLLAHSRAAQGNYLQAIATAQLVPSDTSTYSQARNAIALWKTKQNLKRKH